MSRSYQQNYALIDWSKDITIERKPKLPPARSSLAFPMIISDQMDETEHPCDGKHYTSKRMFRKITKDNGCIEVGNDPQRFRKPKAPKIDAVGIDQAIERAMARI